MPKKIAICPSCHTKIICEGKSGEQVNVRCTSCNRTGTVSFLADLRELDFYPLNEPFAYAKILKDMENLDKYYKVIEPQLSEDDYKTMVFIRETMMKSLSFS